MVPVDEVSIFMGRHECYYLIEIYLKRSDLTILS